VLLDVILELPLPIPRELQGYLFPIRSLGMGAKVTDGALNECLIPLRDDKVMPKKGEALWQRDIRCQPTRRADPETRWTSSPRISRLLHAREERERSPELSSGHGEPWEGPGDAFGRSFG
jgi:hypothetical protein